MKGKTKFLFAALIFTIACVACFTAGRLTAPAPLATNTATDNAASKVTELREGGYSFINPLLECDNYQASQLNSVVQMQIKVEEYIKQAQADKRASFVSVYFRDLNFGPWMGINEKENFSPASLLKVPILIAVFKKAETTSGFLEKKITYTTPLDKSVAPNITDAGLIQIGKTYTIENLVERMITNSDNEAKELLMQYIDESFLQKVYTEIGINTAGDLTKDFISVKDYSGFFRLLYNATYLNRDLSEKALKILSKTNFDKGITAGLPQGITVAHKFGERAYIDSPVKQLHECGIVYLPGGAPYLVCVMTRGTDFNQLADVIAGVSGLVYAEVKTK